MNPEMAIQIGRNTLWTLFTVASPLVFGALVIGFLVGMFQSVTQVREATLSFVPKIIVIGAILWISAPFILGHLIDYANIIFTLIEEVGY